MIVRGTVGPTAVQSRTAVVFNKARVRSNFSRGIIVYQLPIQTSAKPAQFLINLLCSVGRDFPLVCNPFCKKQLYDNYIYFMPWLFAVL